MDFNSTHKNTIKSKVQIILRALVLIYVFFNLLLLLPLNQILSIMRSQFDLRCTIDKWPILLSENKSKF